VVTGGVHENKIESSTILGVNIEDGTWGGKKKGSGGSPTGERRRIGGVSILETNKKKALGRTYGGYRK